MIDGGVSPPMAKRQFEEGRQVVWPVWIRLIQHEAVQLRAQRNNYLWLEKLSDFIKNPYAGERDKGARIHMLAKFKDRSNTIAL